MPSASPTDSTGERTADQTGSASEIFNWAIPVYLLLITGGFAFLRTPIATIRGNELSVDRAAFTAINVVTLTGFEQTIGINDLRAAGQVGVFIMMTGGTALTLIVGGRLVSRIIGLPLSNRRIYLTTAGAICVAALLGAAATGDTVLHGAFQGVSALGNCGLILGKVPASSDPSTMLILLPLAVAGGMGLPIWIDLFFCLVHRRSLRLHSLISLSIYGGAYLVGLGLLLWQSNSISPISHALATSSAASIGARSAGFPFPRIDEFSRSGQWIMAALMTLGAASGGTGGGLKVTTPFVLFRGIRNTFNGHRSERIFPIAVTWLFIYAALVFVGFLVMLAFVPQVPGDRVLFLTLSAASNVGWSHDPISIVRFGLYTLGIIALLGRVLPMAVLWWSAKSPSAADIAVG